jgi:hypothetical protein
MRELFQDLRSSFVSRGDVDEHTSALQPFTSLDHSLPNSGNSGFARGHQCRIRRKPKIPEEPRMHRAGKLAVCCFTLFIIFFSTACGSSNANIRLLNAIVSQNSLDLLIDGKNVASNVGYGSGSAYISTTSGSHHIQAETSGTTTIVADFGNQNLGSNSYSTAASTGNGPAFFIDDHTAPSSGDVKIRVINASALLQSGTDVYVVAAGSGITGTPTFASLAYPSASSYTSVGAGSYQAIFTLPGQLFAEYSTSAQSFSSGQNRTIVVMDGQSGGLTSTVLADLN